MRASKNVPISSSSRLSSSSVSQTARRRRNPIERRLSFCRIRIRRARSFASSVHAPSARLHARIRALARCVRDHSSLSRGHRRRGREPLCSRSRRVVISFVSFVSDVDTTCANADTSRTSSGVRPETARRTSIVYSSYTISSHRRRQRRRRRRAHARRVKRRRQVVHQRLRRRVSRAVVARIVKVSERSSRVDGYSRWSRPLDASTERRHPSRLVLVLARASSSPPFPSSISRARPAFTMSMF